MQAAGEEVSGWLSLTLVLELSIYNLKSGKVFRGLDLGFAYLQEGALEAFSSTYRRAKQISGVVHAGTRHCGHWYAKALAKLHDYGRFLLSNLIQTTHRDPTQQQTQIHPQDGYRKKKTLRLASRL